jgi:urea transport system permease protein
LPAFYSGSDRAADARAQQAGTDLQTILQDNVELVADASRRTVQEVLDILVDSQLPEVPEFLTTWQAREVYQRNSDGLFVYVEDPDADPLTLLDITTGAWSAPPAAARSRSFAPIAACRA